MNEAGPRQAGQEYKTCSSCVASARALLYSCCVGSATAPQQPCTRPLLLSCSPPACSRDRAVHAPVLSTHCTTVYHIASTLHSITQQAAQCPVFMNRQGCEAKTGHGRTSQGSPCLPGAGSAAGSCASGNCEPPTFVCQLKRPSLADCFRACETYIANLKWVAMLRFSRILQHRDCLLLIA